MENINIKENKVKVFDCTDSHKVLLFKDKMPRNNECECWCLACGCTQIVKMNDETKNIVYTHKNCLELLNSLNEIRAKFLEYYYESEGNIKESVTRLNDDYTEKPKVLTKNKTTM